MIETSRQFQDYLLCLECEDCLNKGGEEWLLPLLASIEGSFPFYDLLKKIPPDVTDGDLAGYAASRNPAIKADKLVHFAMGVFWKASVHSWSGGRKEPLIELGQCGEPIREFLRGEATFPEHMALIVSVVRPPVKLISFSLPCQSSTAQFHNFWFYIPGIEFTLCVGKKVSQEVRDTCFASNPLHPILVADSSNDVRAVFARAWAKGHKAKNVAKYLKRS